MRNGSRVAGILHICLGIMLASFTSVYANQRNLLGFVQTSSSLTANKTGAGVVRMSQLNNIQTYSQDSYVFLENRGVSITEEDFITSVYNHIVSLMNMDRSDSGICQDISQLAESKARVIAKAISSAYIKSQINANAQYAKISAKTEGLALAVAKAIVDITVDVILESSNQESAAEAAVQVSAMIEDIQSAVARTITELEVESRNGLLLNAESVDEAFSQDVAESLGNVFFTATTVLYGCNNPNATADYSLSYVGVLTSSSGNKDAQIDPAKTILLPAQEPVTEDDPASNFKDLDSLMGDPSLAIIDENDTLLTFEDFDSQIGDPSLLIGHKDSSVDDATVTYEDFDSLQGDPSLAIVKEDDIAATYIDFDNQIGDPSLAISQEDDDDETYIDFDSQMGDQSLTIVKKEIISDTYTNFDSQIGDPSLTIIKEEDVTATYTDFDSQIGDPSLAIDKEDDDDATYIDFDSQIGDPSLALDAIDDSNGDMFLLGEGETEMQMMYQRAEVVKEKNVQIRVGANKGDRKRVSMGIHLGNEQGKVELSDDHNVHDNNDNVQWMKNGEEDNGSESSEIELVGESSVAETNDDASKMGLYHHQDNNKNKPKKDREKNKRFTTAERLERQRLKKLRIEQRKNRQNNKSQNRNDKKNRRNRKNKKERKNKRYAEQQ